MSPAASRLAAALAVLLAVGISTYRAPLASREAVLDDAWFLERDPRVSGEAGLSAVFTGSLSQSGSQGAPDPYYRPVGLLSLRLTHGLAGASAPAFRLVNLLLLVAVGLGLFVAAGGLAGQSLWVALAPGLVVVTHPVAVEVVAFFSGRFDLMAATLGAAALAMLRTDACGRRSPWLAGGLLLLASLSKESALPLALLFPVAAASGRRRAAAGAAVAAVGLWAGLRLLALGAVLPPGSGSLFASVGVAVSSLCLLVGRLVLPIDLRLMSYSPELVGLAAGPARLVAGAGALVLLAAAVGLATRRRRDFALVLGILVLPLVPVLNPEALPLPLADRYLAAGLIGLGLLVCLGLQGLTPGRARDAVALGLVAASLAAVGASSRRAARFASVEGFWATVSAQDHVPMMFVRFRTEAAARSEAQARLREAEGREGPEALLARAEAIEKLGRSGEALDLLARIPDGTPVSDQALRRRAWIHRRAGELEAALGMLDRLAPRDHGEDRRTPADLAARGEILLALGRHGDAKAALSASLDREERAVVRFNRALALLALGDARAALADLDAAVAAEPREPRYVGARGMVHRRLGDEAAAGRDLAAAETLKARLLSGGGR